MQKNEIDNKYVFINQFIQKGKQCIQLIKICRFFVFIENKPQKSNIWKKVFYLCFHYIEGQIIQQGNSLPVTNLKRLLHTTVSDFKFRLTIFITYTCITNPHLFHLNNLYRSVVHGHFKLISCPHKFRGNECFTCRCIYIARQLNYSPSPYCMFAVIFLYI